MSQGIYGDGTVTGSPSGLQALVSTTPTSGTVGGIDRSTWKFWQNIKYSAVTDGGAAVSAANVQHYFNKLWQQLVRGTDKPDLIVADGVIWTSYLESLQAIQRIQVENGPPDMAEAGFESLKYMSADVVLDGGYQGVSTDPLPYQTSSGTSAVGGVPASTAFMLNTKYIHWRPHAERNMVPLDPRRFSVNQDAHVQLIGWAGSLEPHAKVTLH